MKTKYELIEDGLGLSAGTIFELGFSGKGYVAQLCQGEYIGFPRKYVEYHAEIFREIPGIWRAELPINQAACIYYFINSLGEIVEDKDLYDNFSNTQYKNGNYFRTKELAQKWLDTLQTFHEDNP